ncbi:MAG: ATP-binding domain-containing protein [Bacteroidetes bacterium]|nr:ATP-binding domain-containing protein [Bacteroidota bacterium]
MLCGILESDIPSDVMQSQNLQQSWKSRFSFELTAGQESLIGEMADFIFSSSPLKLFILRGYAGTGKTSLISSLVKTIPGFGINTVLLAPTGRAAKVFASYSGKPAYTIHKKIYFPGLSDDGHTSLILKQNPHRNTLFLIDEASMIPEYSGRNDLFDTGNILEDLIRYIYAAENCFAVFIGDTAQLPPVGLDISPALDAAKLSKNYGLLVQEFELTDVVRQPHASAILENATLIREKLRREETGIPLFGPCNHSDFYRINGSELEDALQDAYSNYGLENTVVLCRSNKRANIFNREIRNRLLFRENEINASDILMIVRNNYFWMEKGNNIEFIANGDMVEVRRIRRTSSLGDFHFADISFRWIDYPDEPDMECKVLLNSIMSDSASLPSSDMRILAKHILEGQEIPSEKSLRKDEYFNALQVKFAYAVTVHKSQGGQWDVVFIDQGYFTEDMINTDYFRWLYTALTRASKKVYLVNFHDRFFK